MDKPWIKEYEPRNWILYELKPGFSEYTGLMEASRRVPDTELFVCGSESQAARDWWRNHESVEGVLFYDFEQLLSMNFDKVYGVSEVRMLTQEWKGNPAGSLVLITYKGVDINPELSVYTIGVEKL